MTTRSMENNDAQDTMVEAVIAFAKRRRIDVGFVLVGILLGVFLGWNIVQVAIFGVFIWSILGPIPARLLAGPALFFLSLAPFLLLLKMEDQAEEYAIYAYYFLVMAVIRGIIEIRTDKENTSV